MKWQYQFLTLHPSGLGKPIISWRMLLYRNPNSHTLANGISPSIPPVLFWPVSEARQASPISPSLFNFALESHAVLIWEQQDFENASEDKDPFICRWPPLTNPDHAVPKALQTIDNFDNFPGYIIVCDKSETTNISLNIAWCGPSIGALRWHHAEANTLVSSCLRKFSQG